MKIKKVLFLLILSLFLVGCNKSNNVNITESEVNTYKIIEDNSDMKNVIDTKSKINVIDNSKSINNLDLRNDTISKRYSEAIVKIKDFCMNNSLKLDFEEPIQDRISRMKDVGNRSELLGKLQLEVDTIFFNKIDDDRYETIRIENNNCYYKLIYNPKL